MLGPAESVPETASSNLRPLPSDTTGMGVLSRALLPATVAFLCGACAESREPAATPASAKSEQGASAHASAKVASNAAVVPAPVRDAPASLPRHEIVGVVAAADGKGWCILSVRLEERVSKAALRALWAALEAQQATEWGRFTCRVSVGSDSWADVNEFAILETAREEAGRPRAEPEADEEELVVEIGEDYVIYSFMGLEIIRWDLDDHTRHAWVRDPRTGEYTRVPLADLPRRHPSGSLPDR